MERRLVGTFFSEKEFRFGMLLQADETDGSFLVTFSTFPTKLNINATQSLEIMGNPDFSFMSGPIMTEELKTAILDLHKNNPKLAKKLPFEIKMHKE